MTAGTGVGVWQTAGDEGDAIFEIYSQLWAEVTTAPRMSEQMAHARQVSAVTGKNAVLPGELHGSH